MTIKYYITYIFIIAYKQQEKKKHTVPLFKT